MMNNNIVKKIACSLSVILTLSLSLSFGISAMGITGASDYPNAVKEETLEINGEKLAAFAA